MLQKTILSTLLALALSCHSSNASQSDLAVSVRAGLDLTSYHASTKLTPMIAGTEHFPMGNITVGVDKGLSPEFSAGISGTYNHLYIPALETSVPILRSSAHANYHLSKTSRVGLSASIAHLNVITSEANNPFFGYIHHLMLGLNIKNYINEQVFTHIELMADVTPSQAQSLGILPLNFQTLSLSHVISISERSPYIANISIGYDFDLDSLSLEKLI